MAGHPPQETVTVSWTGRLKDFFRSRRRRCVGARPQGVVPLGGRRSVKDLLESLGVPHVEIGAIRINGRPSSLRRILKGGECIEVEPSLEQPRVLKFVCDIHLARLARRLRMAGFDTALETDDQRLASLAVREQRILLTRDIGLLKRAPVRWGYWVRHQLLDDQWDELTARFPKMRSCTRRVRCPLCNTVLHRLPSDRIKKSVPFPVPPAIRKQHRYLWTCRGCGRVYWPGSHHRTVMEWFDRKGQITSFGRV